MISVDVLGFTGIVGEKKATLGDSSLGEDAKLGQYGMLTDMKKASVKSEILRIAGSSSSSDAGPIGAIGGSGSNPLTNRPMNR